MDRRTLRETFTTEAERYARARPTYPDALFDEIVSVAGMRPGDRVLEIGPGAGHATRHFAKRGMRVVGVELGEEMAAVARRELADLDGVEIVNASFEEWALPDEPFDFVAGSAAFGWVDPEVRWAKAAQALRPEGAVVNIGGAHVAGGTTEYFNRMQACYERWMPGTPPGLTMPDPDSMVDTDADDLEASGLFASVERLRHFWTQDHTTAQHIDLVQTFSGHIALDEDNRRGLLDCLAELLDRDFSGRITRATLTLVAIARTRPQRDA